MCQTISIANFISSFIFHECFLFHENNLQREKRQLYINWVKYDTNSKEFLTEDQYYTNFEQEYTNTISINKQNVMWKLTWHDIFCLKRSCKFIYGYKYNCKKYFHGNVKIANP